MLLKKMIALGLSNSILLKTVQKKSKPQVSANSLRNSSSLLGATQYCKSTNTAEVLPNHEAQDRLQER